MLYNESQSLFAHLALLDKRNGQKQNVHIIQKAWKIWVQILTKTNVEYHPMISYYLQEEITQIHTYMYISTHAYTCTCIHV